MKKTLLLLTCLATFTLWPVLAEDSTPTPRNRQEVEMALLTIDLRVTLKMYEKLQEQLMKLQVDSNMEERRIANEAKPEVREKMQNELSLKRGTVEQVLREQISDLRMGAMNLGEQLERLSKPQPKTK